MDATTTVAVREMYNETYQAVNNNFYNQPGFLSRHVTDEYEISRFEGASTRACARIQGAVVNLNRCPCR